MSYWILKDIPRYDCLVKASEAYPDLNIGATQAYLHLLKASDEVQKAMQLHFDEHGISQGRFLVMVLLMPKNSEDCKSVQTPAALAEQAQVSRATITGLLDTLERDGYIVRTPSEEDRRQIIVELTPAGLQCMDNLLPKHFRLIADLFARLSARECDQLMKILQKLTPSHD